jgi:DNA-binding response OmpR family regulator
MSERIRILIADDEAGDRAPLCDLSRAEGYAVLEAAGAEEAFATSVDAVPDLAVLDAEMPPGDGYAVCKRLRSHPRTGNVPVLMLTCHGSVEGRVTGLRAGADDCVGKPCADEELLARIDALFRRCPPGAASSTA